MVPMIWKCLQMPVWASHLTPNVFLRERAAGSLSLPNLDALLYFLGISKTEISGLFQQ
jgi:hypothetical protein